MNDFPLLTLLILVPLAGALAVAFLPAVPVTSPSASASWSSVVTLAVGRRGRGVLRRRRRRPPADRDPRLDLRVRRALRARCRRARPADGAAHRGAGAARAAGRLERRRQSEGSGAQPVRGLDAGARGAVAHGLRRHRRVPLLRRLRGDADPGVLPDRWLRPREPLGRGAEVPDVPARWRTGAARLGDRALRRLGPAGLAVLPLHRPPAARHLHRRGPLAVRGLLHRLRDQGAAVPAAHLVGRHDRAGDTGDHACCWSACSTRSAPSGCCGSAWACSPRPPTGRRHW